MAITLHHQTAAQFIARLREAYRNSDRERTAQIATWILNRIDAGDLTELQVRNAFGLTAGQWTTLKAKMVNLRTAYNAVQAAGGE